MAKPIPIWLRFQKDPVKRERMFKVLFFLMVGVNALIVIGFLVFVFLLVKRI
ncbi:MAG: hypothetical protein O2779_00095 [Nanoarchaeota archaeon]|nr:hypothetical protein [Nanoarchaeota archaeon]